MNLKNELKTTAWRYAFFLAIAFFMISLTSAMETVKLGDTINLTQGCAGSTYSNISQIKLNGQLISSNQIAMISTGGGSYTYPYTPTQLGTYYVLTHCNENGVDISAPYSFEVTASGDTNLNENAIPLVLILVVFAIIFMIVGYSIDSNKWLLKSALYLTSMLIMLINIALGIQLSQSSNISKLMTTALIIGTAAFGVLIMYMFVIYLINIARQIRETKRQQSEDLL